MDVKSFVADTLTQILDGIREAQKRPGGQDVVADGYITPTGNLLDGGTSGFFSVVDFDISVVAETTQNGGTVRVADSQFTDGNSKVAQNASRVKFSLYVRLPAGGPNRMRGDYE